MKRSWGNVEFVVCGRKLVGRFAAAGTRVNGAIVPSDFCGANWLLAAGVVADVRVVRPNDGKYPRDIHFVVEVDIKSESNARGALALRVPVYFVEFCVHRCHGCSADIPS